ncbi:MAG: alkaline phosphatase family protein [Planctomycetes bacterium]|nr:alkaline phosphatase family protein [Planctomycetota bacterium]
MNNFCLSGGVRPASLALRRWCLLLSMVILAGSCREPDATFPKVIVLGFDGMDPKLCERLMDAGQLPHLSKMRDNGGYRRLATTIPPQSPVAWASFITGADPGIHGVFDFIHRDASRQCVPYYSVAETIESDQGWEIGDYKIPLTFWPFNHQAVETKLRRGGTPFWDYLDEAGVPVRIYDIPANYPPSPSHAGHMCCLSGMGVPDLLGTLGGMYQFFSDGIVVARDEPGGGGMRHPLVFKNHTAKGAITGPRNVYDRKGKSARVPFVIHRHPSDPTARIEIQDQTIVLQEGEWSDWQEIDFELEMPSFLPNAHVVGMCRFYLQKVHPTFRLYVTPINIDPSDPGDQKISEPPEFVTRIADELGRFYTTGFQEDHKALSNKVFSDEEFRQQADYVLEERLALLEYALTHYNDGLLFFYFSSTDLQAHMFWWESDEKHPMRSPTEAAKYNDVIVELYKRMDQVVGDVVQRYGETATILVMSDHGFVNFKRQFNLNTWLRKNGYLRPSNCGSLLDPTKGSPVDWSGSRAYGMGLNGLYVNLKGRELYGSVDPEDRNALLSKITEQLLAERDPQNGKRIIAKVYRTEEVYTNPDAATVPDLIIGYESGYRASWATTLGDLSNEVVADNDATWSADHCIASDQVPGVLYSNHPIATDDPSLLDLAPTILTLFHVEVPQTMTGVTVFDRKDAVVATVGFPGKRPIKE